MNYHECELTAPMRVTIETAWDKAYRLGQERMRERCVALYGELALGYYEHATAPYMRYQAAIRALPVEE